MVQDDATNLFEIIEDRTEINSTILKKRYWGGHFWARGYFCVTVGTAIKEMIEKYIEHHFEPKIDDSFQVSGFLGILHM